MGGFFSGLAGALGDHFHQQQLIGIQNQIEAKRNLLDNYQSLLKDPMMQDLHDQIANVMLQAAATDPAKLHKQTQKPGGPFDPSQWAMIAQQRRSGQAPVPASVGQQGQIPPPPPGQSATGPAPNGAAMPSWNAAQAPGIPPPPTGIAGGLNASQFPSLDPTQNPSSAPANNAQGGGQSALSVPPPPGVQQSPQQAAPAEQAGNMQAQALQALPPTQGSPAPNGVELASPQQAAAIAPPPAWDQTHGSLGGLTPEALFQRELEHTQRAQQATNETALQFAQRKLAAIEPYLKTVDPQFANIIRMETVQGGNGATGMTAMINTVFGTPQKEQIDATDMTPDQKAYYGLPPSAAGKWTALRSRTGQILPGAYQGWAGTTPTTNTAGEQGRESTNTVLANGGKLTAPGGGPSTVLAPQATTWVIDPQDPHYEIGVRKDRAGNTIAATAPDGSPLRRLKTGTLEHTSSGVQTPEGYSSSTHGVVIPPPPTTAKPQGETTPPKPSGNIATPAVSPKPSGGSAGLSGNQSAIQRWAQDRAAGLNPKVPPKYETAVTKYMVDNNISSPNPLSAKGQSDLGVLDPVLTQVQDIMKTMHDRGLDANGNPLHFTENYQKYKNLGLATPDDGLFTGLSFEALRSAAAALKGTNSRALPILNRALQHTPNLDRAGGLLPDSPAVMYDKLREAEKILRQGKNSILSDEKKSGMLTGAPGGGPASPPQSDSNALPGGITIDDINAEIARRKAGK